MILKKLYIYVFIFIRQRENKWTWLYYELERQAVENTVPEKYTKNLVSANSHELVIYFILFKPLVLTTVTLDNEYLKYLIKRRIIGNFPLATKHFQYDSTSLNEIYTYLPPRIVKNRMKSKPSS